MSFQGNQVIYTSKHWETLAKLRSTAKEMMRPLIDAQIYCMIYGSIARGDVKKTSDIDVYISNPPSPTIIEAVLESAEMRFTSRVIVQATPSYVAKAYIYLDEVKSYSFPLVSTTSLEEDFTGFAGRVSYNQLKENVRAPGVNKKLLFIEPNEVGHIESPLDGVEGIVAKRIGVNTGIVLQRIRILRRREKVGRTGVYIKRELELDESFSSVINELKRGNSAIRRRLRKKG
jgi:predicted nucleotidyltransferase